MNCDYCLKPFVEPKLLPCGAFVCNKCIQNNIIKTEDPSSKTYKCFICDESHEFNADKSFKTSMQFIKMLNLIKNAKQIELESGQTKLKQTIKSIETRKNELENLLKNGKDYIKDYYKERINEVDLAFEQTIEKVQNARDEVLTEIRKIEKEQVGTFERNKEHIDENRVEKLFKDIEQFDKDYKSLEIEYALAMSENINFELSKEIKQIQSIYFNNSFINFNKKRLELIGKQVGLLNITNFNNCEKFKRASKYLDFTEMEKIDLKDFFVKVHPFQTIEFLKIEHLSSGGFGIVYTNKVNKLSYIVILSSEMVLVKSIQIQIFYPNFFIFSDKLNIYISFKFDVPSNKNKLTIIDQQYNVNQASFSSPSILCSFVTENYIHYLREDSSIQLYSKDGSIFGDPFYFDRTNENGVFYIQNQGKIDSVEMIDDKLIVKFHVIGQNMLSLEDMYEDNRIKVFDKHGNALTEMKICGKNILVCHAKKEIIVLNESENKLVYMDIEGNLIKEIKLTNVSANVKLSFDSMGEPVFCDFNKAILFRKKQ